MFHKKKLSSKFFRTGNIGAYSGNLNQKVRVCYPYAKKLDTYYAYPANAFCFSMLAIWPSSSNSWYECVKFNFGTLCCRLVEFKWKMTVINVYSIVSFRLPNYRKWGNVPDWSQNRRNNLYSQTNENYHKLWKIQ